MLGSVNTHQVRTTFHTHQIHLQWIPSHIDLEGNEIADTLTKTGACEVPEPSPPLTFLEIFSRTKHQNKTAWITPSPTQSSIGISVLVLEALWLTVLKTRSNSSSRFREREREKWPYQNNEIFRRTQEL
ncbi:RNase H domain-containing protein [Trichonephila clavipes]|nr:RNase H domain-containing protein [Trichonephila clavipes]